MLINDIEPFYLNPGFHDTIERLALSLEEKDTYTGGHSVRVGDMAYYMAREIGLRGLELEKVHIAAHLHDIGKICIPEYILNKKEPLSKAEWELIKQHPVTGYNILKNYNELAIFADIILHHHERWDGKGYPSKLEGAEIPLGSRIIAVCDTIDAMTSDRPYRQAFSFEETKNEIKINKSRQFDPDIVDALEDLWGFFKNQIFSHSKKAVGFGS
jgi:putative nucleotidyltransferase with HDIG domain